MCFDAFQSNLDDAVSIFFSSQFEFTPQDIFFGFVERFTGAVPDVTRLIGSLKNLKFSRYIFAQVNSGILTIS